MIRRVIRSYVMAFRGLPVPVWRLAAVFFANRAGTMVLPFLSLYVARELGLGAAAAGSVVLAFGLGSLAGSYAGGALSSRFGAIRVSEWVLALSGFAFVALVPLRSLLTLWVGVLVASAVSEAFRPACLTAVAEATPPGLRVRSFALIRLAANAGMAIGPAAAGLLAEVGYAWIFVGDAVTCWLAALLLYWTSHGRDPQHDEAATSSSGVALSAWRDGPFLALCAVLFGFSLILFQAFSTLPVYWSDAYGLPESKIGIVFAVNALLITTLEMPLVRLLEKRDAIWMLAAGSVFLGAGFALMPLSSGMGFAVFTVTIWTFGEMLGLPFANAIPMQMAGPRRAGQYMGVLTSAYSAAFIVAGPAGFAIYSRYGGAVLWGLTGVGGVVLAAACVALAPFIQRSRPGTAPDA